MMQHPTGCRVHSLRLSLCPCCQAVLRPLSSLEEVYGEFAMRRLWLAFGIVAGGLVAPAYADCSANSSCAKQRNGKWSC